MNSISLSDSNPEEYMAQEKAKDWLSPATVYDHLRETLCMVKDMALLDIAHARLPVRLYPGDGVGMRCNRKDQGRTERLEIRPPAALSMGTPSKRRGGTGSATHGAFPPFQKGLKRSVNERQTKTAMTADHENPSYSVPAVV